MLGRSRRQRTSEGGVSLIELLVVLVIVAVLAGICTVKGVVVVLSAPKSSTAIDLFDLLAL